MYQINGIIYIFAANKDAHLLFPCGVMVAPLILVQKIVVRAHAGKLIPSWQIDENNS